MSRDAPTFYVKSWPKGAGKGEPLDLADSVLEFAYEDSDSKADKLTLKVNNFDLENFDNPIWAKGGVLEVQWGYPGNMSPARECVIQSVKGFQVLTVEALDKGILMNKETRSRTFESMTRSQVVRQIAEEEGYTADRLHIEDTAVVYDHIVQARTTNAQFLKILAGKEGFEFFVDFDGLHWHRKRLGQKPIREFVWYTSQRGDMLDFNVENDVTAKPAAVTAKGRDPLKKENFEVRADDKSTQREGAAEVLEVIDPRTATSHDTIATAAGTAVTSPTTEPNADAAKRAVDGKFRQASITVVQASMKTIGDPSFVAKSMVRISGIRSLSGNYYVSSVKHTISQGGSYVCDAKVKRDGRSSTPKTADKVAPSNAATNNQPARADDGSLEPIETIDGRRATTAWTDTRGRGG